MRFSAMPYYSLVVSLALTVLYVAWLMTGMRRQTHWRFNRIAMLMIVAVSLAVGLLPFVMPAAITVYDARIIQSDMVAIATQPLDAGSVESAGMLNMAALLPWLQMVYCAGLILSVSITLFGLIRVWVIIRKCTPMQSDKRVLLFDGNGVVPFSWWKWVVMTKRDFNDNGNVVLAHELAHLRCRHWIDLLVINFVKALTWYCPTTYLLARDIAVNHEFDADDSVLAAGHDAAEYQKYLIEKATNRRFANSVVCGINNPYSLIKTRIIMMQKQKTRGSARFRALGLVPVTVFIAVVAASPRFAANARPVVMSQPDVVTNKVKVTECAITLTDEELMQPREADLVLPEIGSEVWKKWMTEMKYPKAAGGAQGRVLLKVRVSTAGKITNVSVFQSSGNEALDNEAKRVVDGTEGLTPATYKGNKADIDCLLPIVFNQNGSPIAPLNVGDSGFILGRKGKVLPND